MAIVEPTHHLSPRLASMKMFSHASGYKTVYADLNVTPLVDMFVILVLFLVANFSATGEILSMSNDVQLPVAANTQELIPAPVIVISKQEVLVSGFLLGRIDDLTRDAYLNIPTLEEKLREMRMQYENLHAAANDLSAFKGNVNIQGDKNAKFSILKRVMFSCAAAGYSTISFATLAGEKEPTTDG